MPNIVIVGMQWGDQGKGKIVDLICPAFDAVVRYQGGHNAGHTVRFGEEHFSLHLIPSGILHPEMQCALGNGMVVAPDALFKELEMLQEAGVETAGRLFISNRAHLVLPTAVALDQAREAARGDARIGTTSRGIGPTYEGKASRSGLRICDLYRRDLEDRVGYLLDRVVKELKSLGVAYEADPAPLLQQLEAWKGRLEPFLSDTEMLFHRWSEEGKNLLLEGAQGTLLDLDHGTFPFVTSSNSTAGGAATGTGLPPMAIGGAVGILKGYSTRVGAGPFATELEDSTGDFLRERGNEFGTTTGRPRRCGGLDLVATRYARRVNGIGAIALTKMDVMDDLKEIQVCVGYRQGGEVFREYGARFESGEPYEPVYRTLPGWSESTVGATSFEALPAAARAYVEMVEQEIGAPVAIISTGPRREETILRQGAALTHVLGNAVDTVLDRLG